MHASTRRAALGAILAAPLAAVPVPAVAAPSSDLARACEWCERQVNYINTAAHAEDWDDDRLDLECDRLTDEQERICDTPSRSMRDLAAKAGLIIGLILGNTLSHEDRVESDLSFDERLAVACLREVIALCA